LPVGDRLAQHRALVPGVVGGEQQRVLRQRLVVRIPVIGDLESRHHRAHGLRHALTRVRGVGRRQVLRELDADLELDDEVQVVRRAHAPGALLHLFAVQRAADRIVDTDHGTHLRRGERDLPSRHRAEIVGLARDELVLNVVGRIGRVRRELRRQWGEGRFPAMRIEQQARRALGSGGFCLFFHAASPFLEIGARGGTRTRTTLRSGDFKSPAATGYATRADCEQGMEAGVGIEPASTALQAAA
jgi:hypothetical protein